MTAIAGTSLLLAAAGLLPEAGTDAAERRLASACLQGAGCRGRLLHRAVATTAGRWLLRAIEAASLPGISTHYRWRKRRIKRWAQPAIDHGVTQLIVLGAGFDSLSARLLARNPRLQAIEIDRPATLALKERALHASGLHSPRLCLLPVDLARTALDQALADCAGFDPGRPSLVIAEGLLMYLDIDAANRLVTAIRAATSASVQVIATLMQRDARGRIRFHRQRRWVDAWLAAGAEPFRSGVAAGDLAEACARLGLASIELADPGDTADPDPCPGEWLLRGWLRPLS